ncbi:glycosyltransferase [Citrobacter portucalensis]|uniref:glycosyltransferase n=1 Tax=Citrobacter TaxID=544 RepID=UPI0010A4695C|nr:MULTISPECIES: glycosyltransferase [Citrobacter]MDM3284436.1 glycosyltransferase [Citrobacter sp. Cf042]MDN4260708.1 glycosyltransferase [Citrobacter freundii]MEB0885967.1 glycosyltransferase [Citrobacter freundii]QCD02448.1 glycosyltransferase [Citrobacter portucalensis]HCB1585219.1 glycosyltransferase [Citrobacter freundii]
MNEKFGVSGLLALNNIDDYTRAAIDSILNQSRPVDELVIVVNGRQCESIIKTLSEWYCDSAKVKLVECGLEQLSFALNLGLTHCSYKYVARMDADDISHYNRIEVQLNYIESQSLDMIGCAINKIDTSDRIIATVHYPVGSKINKKLPFANPFCHPSVMYKKETIIKACGYNAGFKSEDYDLWLRLARMSARWDNASDVLFSYRVHDSTAQRKSLAYAELAGLMFREMLINKSLIFFMASLVAFIKFFIRGKN